MKKNKLIAWFERQDDKPKLSIRERYKRIANSEWFKKTHEGMSVSDDEKVDNVNKVEPKFKVGDYVVNNETSNLCHIFKIEYGQYICDDCSFPITKENEYHLWTIQDAKEGDVIINWNNTATPSTKLSHLGLPEPQFGFHPATKEQRNLLFSKMKEAGYEWDAEKKELKNIEQKPTGFKIGDDITVNGEVCKVVAVKQKPAWSKEDEKMCRETIDWFEKKCFPYALENDNPARESIKWLKSIKNRVLPQPKQEWNEEDKRILDALITSLINERFAGRLEFLKGIKVSLVIDWLKSLKEKIKGE